jgi:hypothetical protein
MKKNRHYVVDPPTIEKCQELSKQLFYTRLARSVLVPPLSCSPPALGVDWFLGC